MRAFRGRGCAPGGRGPPPSARRPAAACPRRAAWPTSCAAVGSPSSPKPTGTLIAGWPVTLNSAANGVKRPERSRSASGFSPRPVQSPIASGRSASAGVSSRSYSAKKATSAARQRLQLRDRAPGSRPSRASCARSIDRPRQRLDLVLAPAAARRAARRSRCRAPPPGRRPAMNSPSSVAAGQRRRRLARPRGRARRAARPPRACRARTPDRRRRRAALCGRHRRPAGGRGRAAPRSRTARPAAAPTSRRRPRSRRARRAAAAVSATVRVSTPSQARNESPRSGPRETRPRLGLSPTSPQQAAGMRIEPPPSLPCASGTIPAATAAAEPPEEPPGVRSRSHGLRVGAGVARLGRRQDPELRQVRRADDDEAGVAQAAHEVGVVVRAGGRRGSSSAKFMHMPATGTLALIAIGTPANGRSSPRLDLVGGRRARARRRPRRTR